MRQTHIKEQEAVRIVTAEETANGHTVEAVKLWHEQRSEGCDLLVTTAEGLVHPVEVKAWGEPLLDATGRFTYDQDIRLSQFERASRDPHFRVEIVGGLDAWLTAQIPYQRLTLERDWIMENARPRLYDVALAGLEGQVALPVAVSSE